jgi:SWI/SNF-related matrix-associated actin-dependent regulator 1 of chromatin subfamily A
MRYYYKDTKFFYIGFSYDPALVAAVKKFTGAGYNPQNKEWYVPFLLVTLNPLMKWLKDNGFEEGMHYTPSKRVVNFVEPPEIITPDTVLQACRELNFKRVPRSYQCEGVAYMINHGNCINGDGCGLGKTAQTILTIELLGAFPALIISPASVKYNWKKEWEKWNPERSVGVVERKKKKPDISVWECDVVVINYDILGERNMEKPTAKFKELLKRLWVSCAIDEIHFLKNEKALRTKMAKKITKRIPNVWGLTGTLTQKKPADLIQPFKIIRRFDDIFGDTLEFKFRYCNAKNTMFGFDYSGFSNLEELHELLRMGGYIRRNKRDVLTELPPLIEQTIEVPITNLKEYQRAENDLINYLEKIDIERANNAVNAPHLVMVNTLKNLSIQGKLSFIKTYIKEWLEANEDEQLLVFGVHREPLQALAEDFKAPVIQGGVSSEQKQRIVNEFSQKKCRLLFANIKSAGTGTDGLQENCSNLVYIELPDNSTDLEQTNSRLERMGQKNSIIITYLLSPDTIDVEMRETVKDKSLITGVINRGESEEQLLMKKFFKKHGKK